MSGVPAGEDIGEHVVLAVVVHVREGTLDDPSRDDVGQGHVATLGKQAHEEIRHSPVVDMCRIHTLPGVHLVGTPKERAGVVSFVLDGVHPHDVGTILDARGVAVRAGHHCAQPVMDFFGLPATTRASFAVYSTVEEADALVDAVAEVQEIFA